MLSAPEEASYFQGLSVFLCLYLTRCGDDIDLDVSLLQRNWEQKKRHSSQEKENSRADKGWPVHTRNLKKIPNASITMLIMYVNTRFTTSLFHIIAKNGT